MNKIKKRLPWSILASIAWMLPLTVILSPFYPIYKPIIVVMLMVAVITIMYMLNIRAQTKQEEKNIQQAQSDQRMKEQAALEEKKKEILKKWVD